MRTFIRRRAPSAGDLSKSPLRLVSEASAGHRGSLVWLSVVGAIGAFAEAFVLLIIARLAFALASGETSVDAQLGPMGSVSASVPELLALAVALVLLRGGLLVVQARMMTSAFADVWSDVRTRILTGYLGASWALQSGERDGRLQELLTTYATNSASTLFSLTFAAVALVNLVAFLVTALVVNPLAAVVVVVAGVLVAFLLRPLRGAIRRRSRRSADANLAFATDTTEFAANMQEIRVFDVEPRVRTVLSERVRTAAVLDRDTRFLSQLTPAFYQMVALLLIVGAVGVVYAAGVTRLASLGGIVLIMVRSLTYGQQLQTNYQSMFQTAPYLEMVNAELARYSDAALVTDGAPVGGIDDIVLDHVCYEYVAGRPVLRDVELTIRKGEVVGIVGPSGSGKSTFVQLLLRLRAPTSGRLLAGGTDISTLDLHDWYQHVSFVPQDARLVAGSIADNIRFFRDGIDDAAVERAAKRANLHDEIELMAAGYDTPVGERGSSLSGGQRQRLSIARALAEQPDLVVMDEPTSSLDVRSEALIRETIRDLAPAATVVIIAHRLSTLEMCDRIMVILGGKVEGFDTPARLEATNPFYREALQLSGLR